MLEVIIMADDGVIDVMKTGGKVAIADLVSSLILVVLSVIGMAVLIPSAMAGSAAVILLPLVFILGILAWLYVKGWVIRKLWGWK